LTDSFASGWPEADQHEGQFTPCQVDIHIEPLR
jgi:hypothetical protein